MKVILFVVTLAMWLSACCPQREEPSPPKDAIGWKDYQEGTTKLRGRFLLKKGETTDNGKVEIKVLELMPPDCPRWGHLSTKRESGCNLGAYPIRRFCARMFFLRMAARADLALSPYSLRIWYLRRRGARNQSQRGMGLLHSRWYPRGSKLAQDQTERSVPTSLHDTKQCRRKEVSKRLQTHRLS